MSWLILWPVGIVIFIVFIIIAVNLRKVVSTNEVHILQKGKRTIIKGKDFEEWNVYYNFPQWMPWFGVSVTKLPLYVFDIKLEKYQAYDNGKIPFDVDVTAFFIIKDPELAAKRVADFEELKLQLKEIVKWSIRKTLSQYDIQEIMEARGDLATKFYEEITQAVKEWWVDLKNIEFMDIIDAEWFEVIRNLLEKKRKAIESDSKNEVARKNRDIEIVEAQAKKEAEVKRIENEKEAKLAQIEADKLTRTQEVEKEKLIRLQEEESKKQIFEKQKETKQKELDIKLLEEEREAEIQKVKEIIDAEKSKEIDIKNAEAKARTIELDAEARARAVELDAEAKQGAVEKEWLAKAKSIDYIGTAEAKNKMEMAKALNMFSQTTLEYLTQELNLKYNTKVDLEKAKALEKADIKVISTGANGDEGMNSFMDLFTSKGGANVWAMVESFKNTVWEEKFNEIAKKAINITKKKS